MLSNDMAKLYFAQKLFPFHFGNNFVIIVPENDTVFEKNSLLVHLSTKMAKFFTFCTVAPLDTTFITPPSIPGLIIFDFPNF